MPLPKLMAIPPIHKPSASDANLRRTDAARVSALIRCGRPKGVTFQSHALLEKEGRLRSAKFMDVGCRGVEVGVEILKPSGPDGRVLPVDFAEALSDG
jgi:hypothetical protein